jgi:hypothetical protein
VGTVVHFTAGGAVLEVVIDENDAQYSSSDQARTPADRHILRRSGPGSLQQCSAAGRASATAPTRPAPNRTETSESVVQAQGGLYGVGVYNTQQVADELVWIDENVQPLDGNRKHG